MKNKIIYTLMCCFLFANQSDGMMREDHDYVHKKRDDDYTGEILVDLSGLNQNRFDSLVDDPHQNTNVVRNWKKRLNYVSAALPYVLVPALYYGYNYMYPDVDKEGKIEDFSFSNTTSNFWGFLGGQFLMAPIVQKPVNDLMNFVAEYLPDSWLSGDKAQIRDLEMQYEQNKQHLSEGIQSYIESAIGQAKMLVRNGGKIAENEYYKMHFDVACKLTKLPFERKKVDYHAISDELENIIDGYSEDFKNQIRNLVVAIDLSSRCKKPKKNVFFFLGAPGTGKTRLAQLLAKLADLKFYKTQLNKKPDQTLGSCYDNNSKDFLLDSLTKDKKNHQNIIVLIDEVDKVINGKNKHSAEYKSYLLEILEKNQNSYTSGKINADIDISSIIFIVVGNKFPDDPDGSLKSRMQTIIEFPSFEKDKKLEIARKYFFECLDNYSLPIEITENDELIFKSLVDQSSNDGVRELLAAVDAYGNYKASHKRLPNIPPFDVKQALQNAKEDIEIVVKKSKLDADSDESTSSDND